MERCPEGGNDNPFQCSYLGNITDRQRSLVCYSPWGQEELDTTEWLSTQTHTRTHGRTVFLPISGSRGHLRFSDCGSLLLHSLPLQFCVCCLSSDSLPFQLFKYSGDCMGLFILSKIFFSSHYPWFHFHSVSVMSDSLPPHGLQHARPPCPSPTARVYSNSCPSSRWCHPAISSSVVPFFSCLQSFPASGSFQMSQLFASGGQSIGASASVLPVNIHNWFPLGWTGWISL